MAQGRGPVLRFLRRAGTVGAVLAALVACTPPASLPPDRVPRFVAPTGSRPHLALVLGSGGPRGFAHVGVLKVLEENGIHPDLIVGSSVGAMVGAIYASGMNATALEKVALGLNLMEFFEVSTLGGGEASGGPIEKYVNECVHDRPLEELGTGFVVVATRQRDGHLALFNHGDTGRAVRASAASPGEFRPVPVGGELYVDGDEASPVPIRVARQLGAEIVIAVDVSAYLTETPAGVPREWVEKDERRARQIQAEAPGADVLLHPDIGYYAGHNEEYRKRVIAAAERYTREKMPEIRAALNARSEALDGADPVGRSLQVAAALVPVAQHPAHALAPRHLVHVARGAVRVAVDHEVAARIGEGALHRARGDVHDVHLRGLLRALAFHAHAVRQHEPLLDRARERGPLPRGVAHLGAEGLVLHVVGAERVAVHEQRSGAVEVDLDGIIDQRRAGLARKPLRGEEVAVAVHEGNGHALRGGVQPLGDAAGKGKGEPVVAHPVLEEVAQDVERLGVRRHVGEETLELRDDRRARGVEVEVRDEERAPQRHSAFSITTGVEGTFWCMPVLLVATLAILSTTSLPSTTLPNTA